MEAQLLGEVIALREAAAVEQDPAAGEHLRTTARNRELQLMLLLETSGRPLAARALAERLAAIPSSSTPKP